MQLQQRRIAAKRRHQRKERVLTKLIAAQVHSLNDVRFEELGEHADQSISLLNSGVVRRLDVRQIDGEQRFVMLYQRAKRLQWQLTEHAVSHRETGEASAFEQLLCKQLTTSLIKVEIDVGQLNLVERMSCQSSNKTSQLFRWRHRKQTTTPSQLLFGRERFSIQMSSTDDGRKQHVARAQIDVAEPTAVLGDQTMHKHSDRIKYVVVAR